MKVRSGTSASEELPNHAIQVAVSSCPTQRVPSKRRQLRWEFSDKCCKCSNRTIIAWPQWQNILRMSSKRREKGWNHTNSRQTLTGISRLTWRLWTAAKDQVDVVGTWLRSSFKSATSSVYTSLKARLANLSTHAYFTTITEPRWTATINRTSTR